MSKSTVTYASLTGSAVRRPTGSEWFMGGHWRLMFNLRNHWQLEPCPWNSTGTALCTATTTWTSLRLSPPASRQQSRAGTAARSPTLRLAAQPERRSSWVLESLPSWRWQRTNRNPVTGTIARGQYAGRSSLPVTSDSIHYLGMSCPSGILPRFFRILPSPEQSW